MQMMLENQRMCRSWRIFLKSSGQFNPPGNNTVLRFKGVYINICYVELLIQDSSK